MVVSLGIFTSETKPTCRVPFPQGGMFATADWTNPKVGGLLAEVIAKEEKQARQPKPRVQVKHVWDPNYLAARDSIWREVQPRMSSRLVQQNAGTQIRNILEFRVEPLTLSSRAIGSSALCHTPQPSRYARQKPFPDPGINSYNGPNRCQVERLRRELRNMDRPWRTPCTAQPLPSLVPRSAMSSFCLRPGDMPLG